VKSQLQALLTPQQLFFVPQYLIFLAFDQQHFANHYLDVYDGPSIYLHLAFFNITAEPWVCSLAERQLVPGASTWRPWCRQNFPPRAAPGASVAVLPHAAYGWRQPNSFDYPPAYLVVDNFFLNVTLRHHVWTPRFNFSLETDFDATVAEFLVLDGFLTNNTWYKRETEKKEKRLPFD
jgi:hypothetical protein